MDREPPGEDRYPSKMGNFMTFFAWLIFLGILTFYFNGFLNQQNNPNSQADSILYEDRIEIVLDQNRGGHYVATMTINGFQVEVIIDTGATMVSIPEHIANDMELIRGPMMEVTTANGTIPVYASVLDKVQLGEIVVHNVRASINPHMQDDFVLLGMSFLKQMEFTQRQNQLILRQYRTNNTL